MNYTITCNDVTSFSATIRLMSAWEIERVNMIISVYPIGYLQMMVWSAPKIERVDSIRSFNSSGHSIWSINSIRFKNETGTAENAAKLVLRSQLLKNGNLKS